MESHSDPAHRLAAKEEQRAIDQAAAADEAERETSDAVAQLAAAEHDSEARPETIVAKRRAVAAHRRTQAAHEKAARLHEDAAELQRTHAKHEAEKPAPP